VEFEPTTLVAIGTDSIGSYKYNYHTTTTMHMTAPDDLRKRIPFDFTHRYHGQIRSVV